MRRRVPLPYNVDQTPKEHWRGDSDVAPANPAAWPITVDVAVRPVAWLHDLPERYDVLHDEARALWLKAWPKQVEHYTIPLYRHEQREPLSTEAACALLKDALGIDPLLDGNMLKMLRAVERAHGIKTSHNLCLSCGHSIDAHDRQYGCAEDGCDCETPNAKGKRRRCLPSA